MSSTVSTVKQLTIKAAEYNGITEGYLAAGKYQEGAALMWPWFKQNAWTNRIWKAIEEHKYLCIMGHGSASKTFTASVWFLCDWISHSDETALVITSDTVPSMDRRIWADFKALWSKSRVKLSGTGDILDSKRMIRRNITDGKNAIHAIAAESDDAQSKIQGLHTKRIRVIIDEADNKYSASIWAAISNLGTSGDFKAIALANPDDKNSEFGFHCEPINGWDSINPEVDFEWKSKLGWHVMRLDGLQSPNIIAEEDKFPFLLTNQGLQDIRDRKGENSPEWWTYVRAWYPPEGLIKVIFPSYLLKQCEKPILWYTTTTAIASCDPAFEGGDNCVLCIGRMGRMATNTERTAVEVQEFIRIKRKDTEKPLAYDFADQIISILKDRGVQPKNFSIDGTGNGGPFADIIRAQFGMDIMVVKFGAAATGRKIVAEDTIKSTDRFKNFVTELWYAAREWCRLGLVYMPNCPRDLRIQLEARRYGLVGKNLIQAETKADMKDRGLSSPDEGDAFCLLIHLVRVLSQGFTPGTFKDDTAKTIVKRFQKNASIWDQTYGIENKD